MIQRMLDAILEHVLYLLEFVFVRCICGIMKAIFNAIKCFLQLFGRPL